MNLYQINILKHLDLYLSFELLKIEKPLYSLSRNFNCFEKKAIKVLLKTKIEILHCIKIKKEAISLSTINCLVIDCKRVLRI